MKKMIFYASAFAALFLGACSQSNKACPDKCSDDKTEVYTGFLPAADAEGVRYTLILDYDDDKGYTTGDYDLVQVYVESDSTSVSGQRDASSFKEEGDFSVINGQGDKAGKKYIKLGAGSASAPMYFLVESDSKLVMVNDQLEPSETPGLDYSLLLVK